ncbi:MAG: hypothetical protein ACI35Q_10125 [Marinilabiliaceae bacterium]
MNGGFNTRHVDFLAINEDKRRVDLPLKLLNGEMPQGVAGSAAKVANTANGHNAFFSSWATVFS